VYLISQKILVNISTRR